jgi:hypothetical protein
MTAATVVMWHVSPARNRCSIQHHGLRCSTGPSPFLWLLPNRADADRLATRRWACSAHNDVREVHVPSSAIEPDPHPGLRGIPSFIVREPVPVKRVSLVALHKAPEVCMPITLSTRLADLATEEPGKSSLYDNLDSIDGDLIDTTIAGQDWGDAPGRVLRADANATVANATVADLRDELYDRAHEGG